MKLSIYRNDITGDISFELDGQEMFNYEISRAITETTNEVGLGIFNADGNCKFWVYADCREFHFTPLDFTDSLKKIRDKILTRIRTVREWADPINENNPNFITFEV